MVRVDEETCFGGPYPHEWERDSLGFVCIWCGEPGDGLVDW